MSSSPERWRLLEELYQTAIHRTPDERAAFLKEACPDEDLRREVESLLRFEPRRYFDGALPPGGSRRESNRA